MLNTPHKVFEDIRSLANEEQLHHKIAHKPS